MFEIEPNQLHPYQCPCCNDASQTASGFVYHQGVPRAVYYVSWTIGRIRDHGAVVDVIVGSWGDEPVGDRQGVSVAYRVGPEGPSFMVVDAGDRLCNAGNLVDHPMTRADVIGTPLAQEVFQILDAIWLQDDRISEVSGRAL